MSNAYGSTRGNTTDRQRPSCKPCSDKSGNEVKRAHRK